MEQNGVDTVPMGKYLFTRLKQLGIDHILGVPGDFNLTLLDHIYTIDGLSWVGTCNELNAAYAADGYSRIKGLPAALITTYGVGELSAICGVGGSFAEEAGMIHIVGTTARHVQAKQLKIHHTLGNVPNDHMVYQKMAAPLAKASTFLIDESTMASEIDRVIVECVKSRLPVYIWVPIDVTETPLDAERLKVPLDIAIRNDPEVEDVVLKKILKAIEDSKTPCILADVSATRHGAREVTRQLAEITKFPSYTTLLGKGIIDETKPYFNGLYNGMQSFPGIKPAVEQHADLVLNVGYFPTDSNTGGFTREVDEKKAILLRPDYCQILGERFDGVHFLPLLEKLIAELATSGSKYIDRKAETPKIETPILSKATTGKITQNHIWQRLGRFLKPDDIVIVEVGTAQFGMPDAVFPENIRFITQVFWSCIGYTVGATLGAMVAAREQGHKGRVVLVVGDGSLQMTVQEIGTYIRNGFTPTIFLINNDGYTIERAIHGPKQHYNEISMMWDHQKMLSFFGARPETGIKSRSVQAKSIEELEAILTDEEFQRNECIQLCEIFMDKYDVCWRLKGQIAHILGSCPLMDGPPN
ncbi:hypothetical protein RUND412_001365 [Rhizina undulata]